MGARKASDLLPLPVNFTFSAAERMRGLEGLPAPLRRLRSIEDRTNELVARLRELYREVASHVIGLRARATAFRAALRALSLAELNGLIDRHNRYYPIEANLPMDLRTGGYLERGEPWRPLPRMTLTRLVRHAVSRGRSARR